MSRSKTLLVLVSFLTVSVPSFAAVRTWVSPSGVDTNPCSLQAPCRNFAAAITAVDPGGEVVALSSAGYGPVTVDKSVAIIAPQGVHAAIAPTSGSAVSIAAGDAGRVVLRNLYLNSQGADTGIEVVSVIALYVEKCVVAGFQGNPGIDFQPSTGDARLSVSDSILRTNSTGIFVGSGSTAVCDSVRVLENVGFGIVSSAAATHVTVTRSSGAFNDVNFRANSGSTMIIEDTASTGGSTAAFAAGGRMIISRCTASSSAVGVQTTSASGLVYVSNSTIVGNATGVAVSAGAIYTRGNNTLQENTDNGSFTDTYPAS